MEQHPIPQNISSYEFRLVGDMTLKQFFQLSSGIIVGLIIFRTPLIGIVKYPLIFIAVMTGVAMAFIPLNGRPFGRWITAFLKAIYSPTEFEWALPVTPPAPVIAQTTAPTAPAAAVVAETPAVVVPPPAPPPEPVVVTPAQAPIVPSLADTSVFTAPAAPIQAPTQVNDPVAIYFPGTAAPKGPTAAPATNTTQITTPERPNIITGLVTKPDSSPLDSAIIEIIDSATGIPARALRTNRLGQFQIATPLPAGGYTIQTEKDGYAFDTVSFEAKNQIIEPIFIQGKSA